MSRDDPNVLTIETVTNWARSGYEWEKVYRYLFLHPEHFFHVLPTRTWSIAHQVIYHGDVDLLKRFLSLFSDEQINIRLTSKDNKTILDVARDRQPDHPAMFTYVEHLFAQDAVIQAAKKSDWRLVTELLNQNRELANEKPPYSNYFLIHFIVQNGDDRTLEDLHRRFQFHTNVLSVKNETPMDIANRLGKRNMCALLAPSTRDRNRSQLPEPRTAALPQRGESTFPFYSLPVASQQPTASSSMPAPPIGWGNIVLNLGLNGNFVLEPTGLINSAKPPSAQPPSQVASKAMPTAASHVNTKKSIVQPNPPGTSSPVPSQTLTASPQQTAPPSEQVIRNMTCMLTQEIFLDPVIASDGQTYEREAIIDWIKLFHCSPATGALMDAKFKDNTELKQLIQSMQRT